MSEFERSAHHRFKESEVVEARVCVKDPPHPCLGKTIVDRQQAWKRTDKAGLPCRSLNALPDQKICPKQKMWREEPAGEVKTKPKSDANGAASQSPLAFTLRSGLHSLK